MDNNDFFNGSPKTMFFSGFISGVAVLAIVAAVFFANMAMNDGSATAANEEETDSLVQDDEADEPAPAEAPSGQLPPVTSDDHILGDVSTAKVILVEYSDFQCPYCTGHQDTLKSIIDEYGNDVALVFRHFPLSFHPEAVPAAVASECAAEQGKFWDYHDELFANSGDLGDDSYEEIANDIGLNVNDFLDCYESGRYEDEIAAEMAGGTSAGVTGTPATYVNGTKVSGAVPLATFQGIIEEEL